MQIPMQCIVLRTYNVCTYFVFVYMYTCTKLRRKQYRINRTVHREHLGTSVAELKEKQAEEGGQD